LRSLSKNGSKQSRTMRRDVDIDGSFAHEYTTPLDPTAAMHDLGYRPVGVREGMRR
jgi:hypothetical protein